MKLGYFRSFYSDLKLQEPAQAIDLLRLEPRTYSKYQDYNQHQPRHRSQQLPTAKPRYACSNRVMVLTMLQFASNRLQMTSRHDTHLILQTITAYPINQVDRHGGDSVMNTILFQTGTKTVEPLTNGLKSWRGFSRAYIPILTPSQDSEQSKVCS